MQHNLRRLEVIQSFKSSVSQQTSPPLFMPTLKPLAALQLKKLLLSTHLQVTSDYQDIFLKCI
jgi:hypothetical protein